MPVRPKDKTFDDPNDAALARDIAMTIDFAERACDGHQLSDEELDELCDAVLSATTFDRD